MKLIEPEVWVLDHIFNKFISNFTVACSYCFVSVLVEVCFNVGVKLVKLFVSFIFDARIVKNLLHKLLVYQHINRIHLVVVLIFKECVVSLSIAPSQLYFSHSSTVSLVANHASVDEVF